MSSCCLPEATPSCKGIARRFAREGCKVVVAEYNEETGRASAEELAPLGGDGVFVRTDWDTALDKIADGFKRIVERNGPNALAFYPKMGYADVGATTYSFGGNTYGNRVFAKRLAVTPPPSAHS